MVVGCGFGYAADGMRSAAAAGGPASLGAWRFDLPRRLVWFGAGVLVVLVSLFVVASAAATTLITSPRDVSRMFLPGHPRFSQGAVAVSPDGQLVYVVVRSRNRLYEFSARGALQKIWTSPRLRGPRGVTTNGDGDVYVADQASGKVAEFTATGKFVTQWSVPDPISIVAAPKGPVYVLRGDANNQVDEYTLSGRKLRGFHANLPSRWDPHYGYTRLPRTSARAIGVDDAGDLIVTGQSSQYLQGLGPCDGSSTPTPNEGLCSPGAIPDNPLVSGEVARFTPAGRVDGHGWLNDYTIADYPGFYSDGIGTGVAVDPDGGAVYVSDLENYIDYLQPDLDNPDNGTLDFGGPHYALSFVCWVCLDKGSNSTSPAAVAFDCRSNLYVLDPGIEGVDVYVNQSPPPDPPCLPANVSRPAILGTAQQGDKLRAHHGTFLNASSYRYAWERCDAHAKHCAAISGASKASYRLTAHDVGRRLRVAVAGHNATGTAAAVNSAATAVVVPPPPMSDSPPSISGSAIQGQTLTAALGEWSGKPTSYYFAWVDCNLGGGNCVFRSIASNMASAYQLTDGDVGSTMRVEVWAQNAYGETGPVVSAPTAVVLPLPPANIVPPSIAGDLTQGQTLTEVHGAWSNNPSGYAIQWEDCTATGASCAPIPGATSPSYTLAGHDDGHAIAVLESASNPGGTATAVSSPTTAPAASSGPGTVPPQNAPKLSLPPVISGTPQIGETLIASTGAWQGAPPLSFIYQWQKCNGSSCSDIAGATSQSYTIPPLIEVGESIRVVVTATNASATATGASVPTGPVPPPATPPPVIHLHAGGPPPT
jgi:hypothetical protein